MTKHKMISISEVTQHCEYMEKTLIPDLKKTMPETAEDIEYLIPYVKAWIRKERREMQEFLAYH